jgi:hypothetical protein
MLVACHLLTMSEFARVDESGHKYDDLWTLIGPEKDYYPTKYTINYVLKVVQVV